MRTAAIAAALGAVIALLIVMGSAQAVGNITMAVPDSVAVGDPLTIVLTGLANETFEFTIGGPKDFLYNLNDTFIVGTYRLQLTFNLDGDYLFTLASGNETLTKQVRVVCDEQCQSKRLAIFYTMSDERIQRWLYLMVFLVVGAELVRLSESHKEKKEFARLMSLPAPRSKAAETLRGFRLFMSPSYGARRVEVNPRLAFHEEKQAVLDEIHKATEQNKRPIGRDYDWEHGLVEKFRTYVVADKNLVDVMAGASRVEMDSQDDLEGTLSTLVIVPNPTLEGDEAPIRHFAREPTGALAAIDDFVHGGPETRLKRDFAPPRHPTARRALKAVIGLFYALDALMLGLGLAAYVGLYVEPLRQFWVPWPPDTIKYLLGMLAYIPLVAYMAYRRGTRRPRGVRSR